MSILLPRWPPSSAKSTKLPRIPPTGVGSGPACVIRTVSSQRAALTESAGYMKKRAGAEPISRVLSRATISLGRRLPAASSNLPGSRNGPDRPAPEKFPGSSLFGLAPSGVCPARTVTRSAVRSYRTFSPLPGGCWATCVARDNRTAVCFLWHCPGPCGRWVLPTTASCGARTFLARAVAGLRLSSLDRDRSVRSDPLLLYGCRASQVQPSPRFHRILFDAPARQRYDF
jgi:hypothetical protein